MAIHFVGFRSFEFSLYLVLCQISQGLQARLRSSKRRKDLFDIVHMDGQRTGELVVSGRLMFAYVMNHFSSPDNPSNCRRVAVI